MIDAKVSKKVNLSKASADLYFLRVGSPEMSRKGGVNRAANMTAEQRSESARKAAFAKQAKWKARKAAAASQSNEVAA